MDPVVQQRFEMIIITVMSCFFETKERILTNFAESEVEYQKEIEKYVEGFAIFLVNFITRDDPESQAIKMKALLRSCLSHVAQGKTDLISLLRKIDEKLNILKEEKRKQERLNENTNNLEETVRSFEQQKQKKQKEIEALNRKIEHLEDKVDEVTHLNNVLKNEKSKISGKIAGFENLKRENGKLKDEVNTFKVIHASERETMEKLVLENNKLKQQVELKTEKLIEMRKEERLMKQTFGEYGGLSADQELLLKKSELSELKEKFTNLLEKADRENFVESHVASLGIAKNAGKRVKKQLEDYFKAVFEARKVVQKNLNLIKKHFKFTVDSLLPIPEVPPAPIEEINCLKSGITDDYEENCGVCLKPLKNGSKSGVIASAMQCHFECQLKDQPH